MNEQTKRQLQEGLRAMGINLPEPRQDALLRYGDLLLEANKTINLTAITDPAEVVSRHFLDSLAPLANPEIRMRLQASNTSLIDIGTGAGFPGIPLAIALPDLSITLLDALNKRTRFLESVKSELRLENTTVLTGRAEDVAREAAHREAYDLATSRAVADLSPLAEYGLPFVRVGGAFLAYKGPDPREELEKAASALEKLGGRCVLNARYAIPEGASREDGNTKPDAADGITDTAPINTAGSSAADAPQRTLLLIEKIMPTPEKYPRRAGIPTKRPL